MSETLLFSVFLNGLSKRLETFSTIAKFGRDERNLDELKRSLVTFDSER